MITATDSAGKGRLIRELAAIPTHLAVTVLGKPFDLDDLLALVARAAATSDRTRERDVASTLRTAAAHALACLASLGRAALWG